MPSDHEIAHAKECRKLGIPYRWVKRGREKVVLAFIPRSKKGSLAGASILEAGSKAGGGDSAKDQRDAARLRREANGR